MTLCSLAAAAILTSLFSSLSSLTNTTDNEPCKPLDALSTVVINLNQTRQSALARNSRSQFAISAENSNTAPANNKQSSRRERAHSLGSIHTVARLSVRGKSSDKLDEHLHKGPTVRKHLSAAGNSRVREGRGGDGKKGEGRG